MAHHILIADPDEAFGLMLKQTLELSEAYSAEHVTSGRITLIVPVAVVGFMRVAYPAADRFYTSPPGELLLFGCGLAILVGYGWMLKIGRLGRTPRVEEQS